MEGKTIVRTLELGENYILAKFDDGDMAFMKIITPDGLDEDLKEFMKLDELAESKIKSKAKNPKSEKEASQSELPLDSSEENYTWKDLLEMEYKDLKVLCDDNDLDTDPKDYDKEDKDEVMEFRKDVAEEIEVEIPKEEKESEKKESGEEKDDKYTWEDLLEMDFEELSDLCDENDLDTDPNDYDEDEEEKFRRAVAKEIDITAPKVIKK